MVWVERDLRGSSSPTHLSKQGCLEQVAQELVKVGFEYFQRRRLQNLSGKPVPVLHHPQSEEFLPHVQLELPMLQSVPVARCPVTGRHWKEFDPILLTHTLQVFIGIYKVPSQPYLLQATATLHHPTAHLLFCVLHIWNIFFLRRLMHQPKHLKWLTYTQFLCSLCLTDSYVANSRILNRLLSTQDQVSHI